MQFVLCKTTEQCNLKKEETKIFGIRKVSLEMLCIRKPALHLAYSMKHMKLQFKKSRNNI